MHILIMGAGALGTLFGARLAQSDFQVSLISRNREHIHKIQNQGIILEELDGSESNISLPAFTEPGELSSPPDLVLVMVKSYHTADAVCAIRDKCHTQTVFLTLQNGIGNLEAMEGYVPRENILLGTTAQGATFPEAGRIRHGGSGPTIIGELSGEPTSRLGVIVDTLRESGFETRTTDNVWDIIWHKLLVNVGINAVTALLEIQNRWIAEDQEARQLCTEAVLEAADIASTQGVSVPESPADEVLNVARATSRNSSSMLQDIQKGKPTEIDAMNGAIAALGDKVNIQVPVNKTLTRLVKSKQNLRVKSEEVHKSTY